MSTDLLNASDGDHFKITHLKVLINFCASELTSWLGIDSLSSYVTIGEVLEGFKRDLTRRWWLSGLDTGFELRF